MGHELIGIACIGACDMCDLSVNVNRFQNIWLNCAFRCQTDHPVTVFDLQTTRPTIPCCPAVPPANFSTYRHRAFAISGPRIWNSLLFT